MTETNTANVDHVVPGNKWEFDEDVAKCFDNMLARSIPSYDLMRDLCYRLGSRFVTLGSSVVDLGASRGEALRPFIEDDIADKFIALEVSAPMREAMQDLYSDNTKVSVRNYDLRTLDASHFSDDGGPSLVLSVLTLQFTPIEYRSRIVGAIYDMLPSGGAFIFVEKILGASSKLDTLFVKEYYQTKERNGYTREDIDRKRAALEGVLVPLTAEDNEQLLRREGFNHFDCFYRNLNFAGWIAIK